MTTTTITDEQIAEMQDVAARNGDLGTVCRCETALQAGSCMSASEQDAREAREALAEVYADPSWRVAVSHGREPDHAPAPERKLITIALSESPPVKVDGSLWPIIARAEWHDGAVECQANHVRLMRVRQHEDGRRIVYGRLESGPGGVAIGWRGAHAGYLIPAIDKYREHRTNVCMVPDEDATIRAIRRVAGVIGDDEMGSECIADLPARELV